MLNKKEMLMILMLTLILAFAVSLVKSMNLFLYSAAIILCIFLINVFAKKIAGFYLDSEIEIKMWEIERYGFRAHSHFAKSFPAGAVIPLISKIVLFPFNSFVWMACIVFDVKPKVYRAAKRHGIYKFSEMTEGHLGLIAAAGIFANILFAIIGYLVNIPEFARLSIFYAFFNMIPLSDLDGNKIFFGSLLIWSILASIVLIGLFYVIFLV